MQTAFRCLSDSKSSYSRSKFLQRSEGNKLNLLLEAFRFYKLTSNSVSRIFKINLKG